MKKVFVIFLSIFIGTLSYSQVSPHALGIRAGGDGDINGAEISYQKGIGTANRLELDFGFGSNKNHNRMFVAGIYHWNWNIKGGFNWYVGPGAAIGLHRNKETDKNYVNVGLGGQLGIEYNFNVHNAPILLSIDGRPMFDFLGDDSGFGWGAALGIRYTW